MSDSRFRGAVVRSLRTLLLVGVLVGAGAVASPVGFAAGQTTTRIDSCTTIDTPGTYGLVTDITSDADTDCIEIAASDVTLDGRGHTLTGNGSGNGVVTDGSGGDLSNVTVERLVARDWSRGIFYLDVDGGTIAGTITSDATGGIALGRSSDVTIRNDTAYDNALGIAFGGGSTNNTIRNAVAIGNKWGIHFERDSGGNTVVDSVARNNTKWGYYSFRNGQQNTVQDLHLDTARLSFVGTNVAARADTPPTPLPDGRHGTGSYAQIVSAGERSASSLSSLSISYPDSTAFDDSRLELWVNRLDDGSWVTVEGSNVNASANRVSATGIETFGTFAPLATGGSDGRATVVTERPVTARTSLTTAKPATETTRSTTETTRSTNRATTRRPTTAGRTETATTAGATTTTTATSATTTGATGSTTTGTGAVQRTERSTTTTNDTSATARRTETTTSGAKTATQGTGTATTSDGPGFGPVAALIALLAAVVLAVRRDRGR